MKVYAKSNIDSRGIQRVENNLIKRAPYFVEFTQDKKEADLIIYHVNGRIDNLTRQIEKDGKDYVIIQYCLRSTQKPETTQWIPLWQNAKMVYSYYDLHKELADDGHIAVEFEFYHAPLGADSDIFYDKELERDYLICTTGLDYLTESVRECIAAARRVGGKVAHLGTNLNISGVDSYWDITDEEVASLYSRCKYVSGLRTKEGFELPAAEGLLCGAYPILFDTYNYRQWYDDIGLFIPEVNRETTIEELEKIFKNKQATRGIRAGYKMRAKERFDWDKIVIGFWEKLWKL